MLLQLENITISYSSNETILENIDLSIEKGDFVGIIGKVGCGKTTLIETIAGFHKPDSGKVLYNNYDIYQKEFDKLNFRRKLQIVFQFPENQFFEQDIISEISYSLKMLKLNPDEIEKMAVSGLKAVGFSDSVFQISPFALSGGQKRRLALACALAIEPEILLLDEPFSGLDACGTETILDVLKNEHNKGTTIVVISHDPNTLCEMCNRIIVLSNKKVKFDGTPVQIYREKDELEKIGIKQPDTQILSQFIGMDQLENLSYDFFINKLREFIKGKQS